MLIALGCRFLALLQADLGFFGTQTSHLACLVSRDPETENGDFETEKRVHRIYDTLETGLQMIPRSLVAPTRGAVDFLEYVFDDSL